jgi:hypothetical protein
MRSFYVFWFFFCAGWGYLSAAFPTEHSPLWPQAAAALPAALIMSIVILWLELRRLPTGRLATRPSLNLKPWNRPMGLAIFIGLTFAFSGFWGLSMYWVFNLPSPNVAFQFFAMGAGLTGGSYAIYRIFPEKFAA